MIVLGLDTATQATAVALKLADGSLLQGRDDPTGAERPGHATRLLPLASELLAEAGLGWGDIERIAVGVGPGTFTGLRIGLASARGLAQSLGTPLVGVSSAAALAHAATTEQTPRIVSVIDARRGEVFVAMYDAGAELLSPQPLAPAAVSQRVAQTDDTDPKKTWLCVGDGVVRYREALERDALELAPEDSPLHRIDARSICLLGERMPAADGQVLPDYKRRPDAEVDAAPASVGSAS